MGLGGEECPVRGDWPNPDYISRGWLSKGEVFAIETTMDQHHHRLATSSPGECIVTKELEANSVPRWRTQVTSSIATMSKRAVVVAVLALMGAIACNGADAVPLTLDSALAARPRRRGWSRIQGRRHAWRPASKSSRRPWTTT